MQQFQSRHRQPGQPLQRRPPGRIELPRHAVEHAQHAKPVAVRRDQRCAGIEPDVRRAGHQRAVGEARVGGSVGDLEDVVLFYPLAGERQGARQFARRIAGEAADHQPVGLDQRDLGDRHGEQLGRERGDLVELGVVRRPVIAAQRGQPDGLVIVCHVANLGGRRAGCSRRHLRRAGICHHSGSHFAKSSPRVSGGRCPRSGRRGHAFRHCRSW